MYKAVRVYLIDFWDLNIDVINTKITFTFQIMPFDTPFILERMKIFNFYHLRHIPIFLL